ncbi:MAG: GPW/gp25 family protein [Anaerolineales bacterium]|nr:GPW/gp25 family protein [Anaerolineales bacterium]
MDTKVQTDIVGRGWVFPLGYGVRGELVGLTNQWNEVEQAMHIILSTALGERVMRPEFGCRIHDLVFAPNDGQTAVQAERYVEEALARWEPRITVNSVTAMPGYQFAASQLLLRNDEQSHVLRTTLVIKVEYTIKATDDPRSLVFPFYLIPGE